jgi:copper(I)-binding protein
VNLFPTRASALPAGLVACALIMTGCSSGQQSQTSTQEPAVNGASGGVGTIALRDVRIRAQVTSAALPPGESVDLLFVAANQSDTEGDRLVSITSDTGTVNLSPADPEIPAARSLIVGKPDGVDADAMAAPSTAVKANATVKLTKPLANALTYNFVFKFERAGQVTIEVPVTAGDAPRAEQPSPMSAGH